MFFRKFKIKASSSLNLQGLNFTIRISSFIFNSSSIIFKTEDFPSPQIPYNPITKPSLSILLVIVSAILFENLFLLNLSCALAKIGLSEL
ncbi:hypothetical protein FPS14_contig00037-0001 [Flavobacterium psychrophilum]|nr:hypothetical protein FPS14_contig00037-0001 [Flavobacterium psychrophilum]